MLSTFFYMREIKTHVVLLLSIRVVIHLPTCQDWRLLRARSQFLRGCCCYTHQHAFNHLWKLAFQYIVVEIGKIVVYIMFLLAMNVCSDIIIDIEHRNNFLQLIKKISYEFVLPSHHSRMLSLISVLILKKLYIYIGNQSSRDAPRFKI